MLTDFPLLPSFGADGGMEAGRPVIYLVKDMKVALSVA